MGNAVPLAVRTTPYLATSKALVDASAAREGIWPGRPDQCPVRVIVGPMAMSIVDRRVFV